MISHNKINKILIIMLGGLGDLVMMVPSLKAIRRELPHASITFFSGEPDVEKIVTAEHLFDEVINLDSRKTVGLLKAFRFISMMRAKHFDLSITGSHMNALKSSFFALLCGIPIRIGENKNGLGWFYTTKIPFEKDVHETDGMIKLLNKINIRVETNQPFIQLFREDENAADKFLSENGYASTDLLIGIHAGSGFKMKFKRWPQERFASLANALIDELSAKIVLTGSELEVPLVDEIAQLMKKPPIKAAAKLAIRETAALIKRCRLFISNDSGIAHIAGAVETPLIVLFGPTSELRACPHGKQVRYIRKDYTELSRAALLKIAENDILNAAQTMLRK